MQSVLKAMHFTDVIFTALLTDAAVFLMAMQLMDAIFTELWIVVTVNSPKCIDNVAAEKKRWKFQVLIYYESEEKDSYVTTPPTSPLSGVERHKAGSG